MFLPIAFEYDNYLNVHVVLQIQVRKLLHVHFRDYMGKLIFHLHLTIDSLLYWKINYGFNANSLAST
jgi:hypothetical protein